MDDLVDGIVRYLESNENGAAVNLGNPEEVKVLELAQTIADLAGSRSDVAFVERPVDDPQVRCPDISRATSSLGWTPRWSLRDGLERTIDWASRAWGR